MATRPRGFALVLVPVYFIKHSVSCYIYYIQLFLMQKVLQVPLADLHGLSSASVMYTQAGCIHITLNHNESLTPLLIKLPSSLCPLPPMYGVIDLYGKCNRATLLEKEIKEEQLPEIFEVLEEDVRHVHEELKRKEIKIEYSQKLNPDEYSQQLPDPVSDVSRVPNTFQQILPSGNASTQLINHPTPSEEASQRIPCVSTRAHAPRPCSSGYLELCRRFLKHISLNNTDHKTVQLKGTVSTHCPCCTPPLYRLLL